jgi:hypothetical protein
LARLGLDSLSHVLAGVLAFFARTGSYPSCAEAAFLLERGQFRVDLARVERGDNLGFTN